MWGFCLYCEWDFVGFVGEQCVVVCLFEVFDVLVICVCEGVFFVVGCFVFGWVFWGCCVMK